MSSPEDVDLLPAATAAEPFDVTNAALMSDEEVLDLAQRFYVDAAEMCRTGMTLGGYRIPKSDSPDQIIIKYFNLLKRYIEPKRRRVWYSREFECPAEHQIGLRRLAKLIEKGQDINPHQSKRLRKPQSKDSLLNDWGVHHFHLGNNLTTDGFAERTGPLLFARVDPIDVYFLTVGDHNDFSRQELVRMLHGNWPEVILPYRLHGILGGPTPWTDSDIKTLRAIGRTSMLQMPDGTIYMGPGGGYSTDGTSTDVVGRRNEIVRLCRHLAGLVRDHVHLLKAECEKKGTRFDPPYQFRLYVINGMAYAWEERHDAVLNLSTPISLPSMSIPDFGHPITRPRADRD